LRQIVPPTNCPACSSILVWINDQLFCKQSDCSAQSSKKIEHFAKTLKIKGLGPATIEKLGLSDYHDIFSLTQEEISFLLDSEKLGAKLHTEIQNCTTASDLTSLLPAFSIPLIGSSASNKLAKHISHISEITPEICTQAGLGPKAASNLMDWLVDSFHSQGYYKLPFSFEFSKTKQVSMTSKGTVCISGKLSSYPTKAAAQKVLEENGYVVKTSITKDVSILFNESGIASSKTKQAEDKGITILTNIKAFIEEN